MIISYKYNWDKIRTEYETGKYTLKQLADKHGQSKSFYSYLRQKASGEKWEVDEEVSKKLTEEVQKRVIGAEAEKEAELRKEYEKILIIYQLLVIDTGKDGLKALIRSSRAGSLKDLQHLASWIVLQIVLQHLSKNLINMKLLLITF